MENRRLAAAEYASLTPVDIPSTVGQVVVLVAVVLPGLVFAAVRSTLRGYGLDDVTVGARVAQALLAGIIFDLIYISIFGSRLVDPVQTFETQDPQHLALIVLALGIAVPAMTAYILFGRPFQWKYILPIPKSPYRPTPSAWDFKLPHSGGSFVRIQLPDGSLIGGWCGSESYVSTFPQPRDIFLESQWHIDSNGNFVKKMTQTAGDWTSIPEGSIINFTTTIDTNGEPDD